MTGQPGPARCTALTRTDRGWSMCHRPEHPPGEAHHVRDRAWFSDGRNLRAAVPSVKVTQPRTAAGGRERRYAGIGRL
jgi:hypothetical protein